jgi:uncharacterized protein YcaQ
MASGVVPTVSAVQAARIILHRAALSEPRPPSSGAKVASMIHRLGYVQIDSIAAVERAHHTILRTRLEGYQEAHLKCAAEKDRKVFEHWTHDACFIPTQWMPYWHLRFKRDAQRITGHAWWNARAGGSANETMRRVLATVKRNGPTRARDLEGKRSGDGAWWGWSPGKAALEALWRCGKLAVSHRDGFQKSYDLFERVHPQVRESPATRAEHLDWACTEALTRLGLGTPKEIAAFFGDLDAVDVQAWARTRIGRSRCVPVLRERLDGGDAEHALALPAAMTDQVPEPRGVRLLSPFDPVVRDRQRLERVWGFSYRFEAFVPQAKRVDGYYTLPVLDGAKFVGRCALRVDRKAGSLALERWRSEERSKALPRKVRSAVEAFAQELKLDRVILRQPRTPRR